MKRVFKKIFKIVWNVYGVVVTILILVGMYQIWYHPSRYLSEQVETVNYIKEMRKTSKEES